MEEKARKRRRRENFQNIVLQAVATTGVLALTALTLPVLLGAGAVAKQAGFRIRYKAKTAAGRLAAKGYVKFVERNGTRHVEITEAGKRKFEIDVARASAIAHKKRRWDSRYRIVMFDIPQRRTGVRNRLRRMMKDFGFLRMQDSVWVSPYDCEELVALVKAELRLGRDVLYVIAEEIENDGWIRRHFDLK